MQVQEYGYEYDAEKNEQLWNETRNKATNELFKGALCLRSGRDALKVIAKECKSTFVFMPALACDSMVNPFKMYNYNIVFYPIMENYSIDITAFTKLICNCCSKTILFLYMDYFGNQVISDKHLYDLKTLYPNIVFIEDRTHCLIQKGKRKFTPDYTIASLRKWLNIPDGGLLWKKGGLYYTEILADNTFSNIRLYAQSLRHEFLEKGNINLKKEYRETFSKVCQIIDCDKRPARMSMYAFELSRQCNWENIRKKREENAKALISKLSEIKSIKLIQTKQGKSDLYVPFLVNNRDILQKKLSSIGIFCTIIWPLSDTQKKICPVASYTEKHMLAAPCDQRYNEKDMAYIGEKILEKINE